MIRKIESLRWARRLSERPEFLPEQTHLRGKKAKGIQYEAAFHNCVGGSRGDWWEYEDRNGGGVCQTDVLLGNCIFECKLSWTFDAVKQLVWLYIPVLSLALGKEMFGIIVTRSLKGMPEWPKTGDLREALEFSRRKKQITTLHWLGNEGQLRRVA